MGLDLTQIATAFMSMMLEGLPFIFAGTLVSGVIDAYMPQGQIEKWLPKRPFAAILMSGLLGIIFPVCECAIVPVIRRLLNKGLPISCAVTYMLAAPIINPITAISTMSAFSGGTNRGEEFGPLAERLASHPIFMTGSRLLIAYIICVLVGLLISRISASNIMRSHIIKSMEKSKEGHNHEIQGSKVVQASRTAMRDCVDTGMYFTIGVVLTAIFNTSNLQQGAASIMSINIYVAVAAMMGLAFLLSLCSTSDAFIGATLKVALPTQAYEYGAKLAFLVFGPMMDVKLLFMYASIFRPKFVFLLFVGLFILVGAACSLWSLIPIDSLPFR